MHSKQEVREQIKAFLSEHVEEVQTIVDTYYGLTSSSRGTLITSWEQISDFASGRSQQVVWLYFTLQQVKAWAQEQGGIEDVVALCERYTPPTQFVVTVLEQRTEGVEVHVYRLGIALMGKAPKEVQ